MNTKINLPKDVRQEDTRYPTGDARLLCDAGDNGCLKFHDMGGRFGWCVATLVIGRNRTYAITLDGETIVTISTNRPGDAHIIVYLTTNNIARLKQYVDIHKDGLSRAHDIRNRVGSRRAEGQERRKRGETYWRWSV